MKRTIKRSQLAEVEGVLFDTFGIGVHEDFIRETYSGRGMGGTHCVGFVIRPQYVAALGAALAVVLQNDDVENRGLLAEMMSCPCLDNMGLDVILYFPGTTVASEEKSDD